MADTAWAPRSFWAPVVLAVAAVSAAAADSAAAVVDLVAAAPREVGNEHSKLGKFLFKS